MTDPKTIALIDESADTFVTECIERQHDEKSGETFTYCIACGLWEEHAEWCPVPVLQAWQQRSAPRHPDGV